MKKTLITTFIAAAFASSVMAQGIVSFSASTAQSRPITYSLDGTNKVNAPAGASSQIPGYGTLNVTMYAASAGTALPLVGGVPNLNGWLRAAEINHSIAPSAGNMVTFNFTQDASLGAAATPVQLIVVGWTGAFTDFQSALTAANAGTALIGWSGSALSGGSLGWNQPTGTTSSPVFVTFGAGGFAGLSLTSLAPVPEPGTIALGGMGVAALLLFRRRK